MKKIFVLICLAINVFWATAQVKTNQTISNGAISTSSAFLDASSSPSWNLTTNTGKGLLFPRVDLTTFAAFAYAGTVGLTTNYPSRFDGMIVYNSATGTAAIGGTAVTPGFYYYANTTTTINGGNWVRMNDANDAVNAASGTAYFGVLPTVTPTATNIQSLTNKSIGCGAYSGNFDQTLTVGGYFTLAVPISWRNPSLRIDGSDTWDVFNPTSTVTINNVTYQVWQTDTILTTSNAIAVR